MRFQSDRFGLDRVADQAAVGSCHINVRYDVLEGFLIEKLKRPVEKKCSPLAFKEACSSAQD